MNAIKEAHYNLGIAYLEAGQYSRAVPEFEAAIQLDPNFIGAHSALCRAYLEQDKLENAGRAVAAALRLDANYQPALLLQGTIIAAYHNRGKACLDDRLYTEAVAAFQKALVLDADLGDTSQVDPPENTHIYVHLGAAYIGMKAYQEAIAALQQALAQDANLVDAHYNLGYAYVEQGTYDQAIPHLERAIAIAPHLKRAHHNLARAYRESGNLEAATHAVTETLRLDANYQPARELADTIKQAHYNSGLIYFNDERYSEAVTAFQNAITLDSDFATAHYNLGLTYLKMEAYPRAVLSLEKTVALDPNHKAAYHTLALAYLGQQELGKAGDTARAALKIDANYEPVRSLLAAIDPSFAPLDTTEQVRPVDPEPQKGPPDTKQDLERGHVFLNSRQYNQAAAAFKRVIKTDANSVEAHYGLGQAYLEVGAFEDAKVAADTVLRLNPKHQQARELIQVIKFARNREKNKGIRKKVLSYVAILGILAAAAFFMWQIWSDRDSDQSIPQLAPPNLSMQTSLNKGYLRAGEGAMLTLKIRNSGGSVRNVKISLQPQFKKGVKYEFPPSIPEVRESSEQTIQIRIGVEQNVEPRKETLRIKLLGQNGKNLVTQDFSFTILGPVRVKR